MRQLWLFGAFEFGDDAVGKHFTEFDAPLIERVNIPDGALHEDFVFVERDQLAQRLRRQAIHQDGIGWVIALKGAMWHLKGGNTVGLDLLRRFAKSQRLGLREEVRHQQIVVRRQGMQRVAEADEIARYQFGSLVNKLVEGVLPVGAGLAPDNGPGLVIDRSAFQVNMLAIAFHIKLLQVGTQATEIIVVRQNRHRLGAEEVVVPDANQSEQHR